MSVSWLIAFSISYRTPPFVRISSLFLTFWPFYSLSITFSIKCSFSPSHLHNHPTFSSFYLLYFVTLYHFLVNFLCISFTSAVLSHPCSILFTLLSTFLLQLKFHFHVSYKFFLFITVWMKHWIAWFQQACKPSNFTHTLSFRRTKKQSFFLEQVD